MSRIRRHFTLDKKLTSFVAFARATAPVEQTQIHGWIKWREIGSGKENTKIQNSRQSVCRSSIYKAPEHATLSEKSPPYW